MQVCEPYERIVPVSSHGSIGVSVVDSPLGCRLDDLFCMALRRNNRKRSFLFVSRILGKHIPIAPCTLHNGTYALAALYAAERGWLDLTRGQMAEMFHRLDFDHSKQPRIRCPSKTLVVGFAETATAMGHCLFDALTGDVAYAHTSRERPHGWQSLLFAEEPHSHATEHFLYLHDRALLERAEEILIVDDELTSANTAANLVEALDAVAPGKRYGILTFLNWGGGDQTPRLRGLREQGIDITCAALLVGRFSDQVRFHEMLPDLSLSAGTDRAPRDNWQSHRLHMPAVTPETSYLWGTGRFGVHTERRPELERLISKHGKALAAQRKGRRTLCLGTGECMYLPLRLAGELGPDVFFHATTRSPAIPMKSIGYGIDSAVQFEAPDDPRRTEYVYNVDQPGCDELFLFVERPESAECQPLLRALERYGFEHYHRVILG